MSEVLLTRYGRPNRHIRLTVESGAFAVTPAADTAVAGIGEVMRRLSGRRIVCALYEHDGLAWFHAGATRWPQAELHGSAEHRMGRMALTARFRLRHHERELFAMRYWVPWVGIMGTIDPTYDGLDHETDDFLFNVTAQLNRSG